MSGMKNITIGNGARWRPSKRFRNYAGGRRDRGRGSKILFEKRRATLRNAVIIWNTSIRYFLSRMKEMTRPNQDTRKLTIPVQRTVFILGKTNFLKKYSKIMTCLALVPSKEHLGFIEFARSSKFFLPRSSKSNHQNVFLNQLYHNQIRKLINFEQGRNLFIFPKYICYLKIQRFFEILNYRTKKNMKIAPNNFKLWLII